MTKITADQAGREKNLCSDTSFDGWMRRFGLDTDKKMKNSTAAIKSPRKIKYQMSFECRLSIKNQPMDKNIMISPLRT